MLDIRAVAYIAPVSEVDFAPVPLTVRLVNFADEPGLVSAGFRIYNDSTGLLIYQSDIIPVEIAKGATVDVSALTDFMPPAPADDTYFVLFDGNAANALVPDGIAIHLGSMYFDVKPAPLGPIPAGHAVTHEDTGIDEVDVTGLSGLLADPQTPILHHLEHETGGSDEINVTNLAGELADDQPPKAHGNPAHTSTFEDQANKGAAGGYCGLPNPLDSALPLRADGTPGTPLGLHLENDFCYNASNVTGPYPWRHSATLSASTGTPAHPGVLGVAAGKSVYLGVSAFLLSGQESTRLVYKTAASLTGLFLSFGFADTLVTPFAAVDGCYFDCQVVGGVQATIYGVCAAASVRSNTATSFVLAPGTWYHLLVSLNTTATLVTFSIFNDAGALLWSDTLNSNIPTAPGQETGNAVVISGGPDSGYLDYIDISIPRPFFR